MNYISTIIGECVYAILIDYCFSVEIDSRAELFSQLAYWWV